MKRPIGLLDSGVGGLTVLESIHRALPQEDIIYIGDQKHCPYGDKTQEQLFIYTSQIVSYFIQQNCKLIVHACNTTSALVLPLLQRKYPSLPFIGVIHPTVASFIQQKKKRVLVIATEKTIASGIYERCIQNQYPDCIIYSLATPLLVPLVEKGADSDTILAVLHQYLDPFCNKIDAIILGCTHYPVLLAQIQAVLPGILYVSSSEAMGIEVKQYLANHNLLNKNATGQLQIYTTGSKQAFLHASSLFFDSTNYTIDTLAMLNM